MDPGRAGTAFVDRQSRGRGGGWGLIRGKAPSPCKASWDSVYHSISIASYAVVVLVVLALAAFFTHRLRELRKEGREDRQDPMRDPAG